MPIWLFWLIAVVVSVGLGYAANEYCVSISDYGDLRGVRDSFVSIEQSIAMTRNAYYTIDEKMLFDAANLKQSTNVAEAIVVARNVILEYNRKLQQYITKREHVFTRMLCAPVPADLKPLVWSSASE